MELLSQLTSAFNSTSPINWTGIGKGGGSTRGSPRQYTQDPDTMLPFKVFLYVGLTLTSLFDVRLIIAELRKSSSSSKSGEASYRRKDFCEIVLRRSVLSTSSQDGGKYDRSPLHRPRSPAFSSSKISHLVTTIPLDKDPTTTNEQIRFLLNIRPKAQPRTRTCHSLQNKFQVNYS